MEYGEVGKLVSETAYSVKLPLSFPVSFSLCLSLIFFSHWPAKWKFQLRHVTVPVNIICASATADRGMPFIPYCSVLLNSG